MKHATKIESEFSRKNLTPIAGLNPIFQFLDHDLDIFSKLDQQVGQTNATLLKKKHKRHFSRLTRKYCALDVDSTLRNTSGHQEATGMRYKKHNL